MKRADPRAKLARCTCARKNVVFHVTQNSNSRMERIKGVPRDAAQYFSAICEECFELYFNGELVILSP